jgi:UDP-N-acetylglucosamine 4,6-dehydratase
VLSEKFLITGITGTAGQAFVRELSPKYEVVGVDRNEERIAWMRYHYPEVKIVTADFADYRFDGSETHVVHLAAMKHIDQCEQHPSTAIKENLFKTHILLDNAEKQIGFDKYLFTYMSTDKACDPASVYGYTKYLAERLVMSYNSHVGSPCRVIRSGNLYGSNGSVVPLWRSAIQDMKPIMLTDDSMKRYFITPDHMAQQVCQQVLLTDTVPQAPFIPKMDMHTTMGEILDKLLDEYGYTRDDYPGGIIVTGLRPGEKMEEALHNQ